MLLVLTVIIVLVIIFALCLLVLGGLSHLLVADGSLVAFLEAVNAQPLLKNENQSVIWRITVTRRIHGLTYPFSEQQGPTSHGCTEVTSLVSLMC